jgi:hypothetical protein
MTHNNNNLNEMEALLLAIAAFSNEQISGAPATPGVANPIVDPDQLTDLVLRVNALVRSLAPPSLNEATTPDQ